MHLDHHARFLSALALGLLAFVASRVVGWPDTWLLQVILGGDVFFLFYLGFTAFFVHRVTADKLRERAANPDEGLPLILLVTVATVVLSLVAVFLLIESGSPSEAAPPSRLALPLAVAAVPLGWLTLHALVAFHYAHLYYAPGRHGDAADSSSRRRPSPASGISFTTPMSSA